MMVSMRSLLNLAICLMEKNENNNEIIFRFANVAKTGVAVYEDYWYQSYRIKRAGYCAFMVPPLDVARTI